MGTGTPATRLQPEVTPAARAAGVMTLLREACETLPPAELEELLTATRRTLGTVLDGSAPDRAAWMLSARPGVAPATLVFLRPIELLVHHRSIGDPLPREVAAT